MTPSAPDHVGAAEAAAQVLVLGGTSEARGLADLLVRQQIPVISSLAGRVARPRLPVGGVRIGGFGGADGLAEWIDEHAIRAVVDATHPFARRISAAAADATARTGVPLVRVVRPAWTAGADDRWITVADMAAAADAVRGRPGRRVFLTTGRQDVGAFAGIDDAWFLIRVVDPPTGSLPARHEVLMSRGPYRRSDELAILRGHRIDLLVTKNSGGAMTSGKLAAAAELGIEVVMVQRPVQRGAAALDTVESVDEAGAWVSAVLSGRSPTPMHSRRDAGNGAG